jgi:hypothetical protein
MSELHKLIINALKVLSLNRDMTFWNELVITLFSYVLSFVEAG